MKKCLAVILILLLALFAVVGCKKKEEGDKMLSVSDVFIDFSSTTAYTKATAKLRLNKGITVYNYDSDNDVFVTEFTYKDEESGAKLTRYGFCSATENYLDPKYHTIIDIKGDSAIVLGLTHENGKDVSHLGITTFRGANKGKYEFISTEYAPLITQMSFLNNGLLAVLGDKTLTGLTSAGYAYATIYDYATTGLLLEVARVSDVDNYAKFELNDGWLSVTKKASVDFYKLSDIGEDGFLKKSYSVRLLTDERYVENYMSTLSYYMGNEWYIVSTTYAVTEEYDGYEIPVVRNGDTYYTLIKSARISMKSGKLFDSERVVMVANAYTDYYVRSIANATNVESQTEAMTWAQPYILPIVPTSAIVKDGYSIVYFYYYYYNAENVRSWGTTFAIYDSDGNSKLANNLTLPVVYVDGKGLQNIDPSFKLPLRDIGYHDSDGTRVTLVPIAPDRGYENAFLHDDVIISYEEKKGTDRMLVYMGATGTDGRPITEFEYDAVSPFFGGYATASKIIEWDSDEHKRIKTQAFYRIGKDGSVTSIPDCYVMCNGVYITHADGKFGLKSNAGIELIPCSCELVSCTDAMLLDGKVFKTYVATVEDGRGVIYELG